MAVNIKYSFVYSFTRFGKSEMEIADGQTCGGSENEKIKISYSKGKFLEGKTFKIHY